MNRYLLLFFCVTMYRVSAQSVTTSEKCILTEAIEETSGLLLYNNKVITHNDSGSNPELHEINTSNGSIARTITINNATNKDWEDLAQDEKFIYVGDIGNNFGNRQDLKFYRILKTDFNTKANVNAEIINYSYADQTNFTSKLNNNNWDAEAFVIYNDYILIFTKNWKNNEVNVYALPKTIGTHQAQKVSNFNAQGLVTGADLVNSNKLYLSGYSKDQIIPFLIEINNLNISAPTNLDVFKNCKVSKIENFIPFGNQVEGICFVESNGNRDTLYMSNEKLAYNIFIFPSKLREITIDNTTLKID